MDTIEERADRAIYEPTDGHPLKACEVVAFARGYELGATEQKAIDDKEIKKLKSIVENSAIVLGIGGVEWVNENARQVAIEELRQEIFNCPFFTSRHIFLS